MGRKRTGSVYPNRQGKLRYKLILPDGFVWDREVPPPETGTLDEEWAHLFLASMRRQVENGYDPRTSETTATKPAKPSTVGDHVISWAESQTYDAALGDMRRLELHFLPSELASLPLPEAKPRHCLAYVKWLKARPSEMGGTLAPRTIRTICGSIQRALDQAVRDELISVTPWNLPPKALPGIVDKNLGARSGWRFALSEVQALCYDERITQEHRAIFAVLFLAGLRTGELVALRVKDWVRELEPLGALDITKSRSNIKKTIKDTKTHVNRQVPVHPALAAILAEWLLSGLPRVLKRPYTSGDLLFPSRQGLKERTQVGMWFLVQNDVEKLGLRERRAHDTRRTHISMLVDADARREVFSVWTHGVKGDVVSSYTTAAWKTYCSEMLKLEFSRPIEQRAVVNSAIDNAISGVVGSDKTTELQGESSWFKTCRASDIDSAHAPQNCTVSQVQPQTINTEHAQSTPQSIDSAIQIALFPVQCWLDEEAALSSIERALEEM